MKYFLKNLVSSIIAGILIAIGGIAFIMCKYKLNSNADLMGSLLFSIGLFSILIYGLNLFTGKVCYFFHENTKFKLNLLTILLGNFIGASVTGYLFRFSASEGVLELATKICEAKLQNSHIQCFLLSCFCGVMIYLAVNIYKEAEHVLAKYFAVVFGVVIFIICGFEHCVATMYYFSVANMWNLTTFVYFLIMVLGNSVGGVALPLLRKLLAKLSQE